MSYIEHFCRIEALTPTKRGFQFEQLINKICDDEGTLLSNSYKTVDTEQQIDGAVEINSKIFLLEAKWEKDTTLAASKLFSFLGKINSKIEGTLGVFISYNELSENFISSVRNGLRQTCIIIHGSENIIDIVEKRISLKDFIWYTYQQAALKNRSCVDSSEFLSLPKKNANSDSNDAIKNWEKIFQGLFNGTSSNEFKASLEGWYRSDIDLSKKTINIFSTVQGSSLSLAKYFILIDKCFSEEPGTFKLQLEEKLKSPQWIQYTEYDFLTKIKNLSIIISHQYRDSILTNIENHIIKYEGNYDEENKASVLVDFLFENLELSELERLSKVYYRIYCDSGRKDKFLQKQVAKKIYDKIESTQGSTFDILKDLIFQDLKNRKDSEYLHRNDYERLDTGCDIDELLKINTIELILTRYKQILKPQLGVDYKAILETEYDRI